jgi:hypothetical protein
LQERRPRRDSIHLKLSYPVKTYSIFRGGAAAPTTTSFKSESSQERNGGGFDAQDMLAEADGNGTGGLHFCYFLLGEAAFGADQYG